MIKIFFLLIGSILILQSATLKNIEVFEQNKSFDVLLLLDESFDSIPQTFFSNDQKIIMFKNISFDKKWEKTFKSSSLRSIKIFSDNHNLYLIPIPQEDINFDIQAEKSKDGKILRIHLYPQDFIDHINILMHKAPEVKLESVNSNDTKNYFIQDDYQYWVILAIMAFLIVVLLIVRRKFNPKYFGKNKTPVNSLQIIFSKNIDSNNKIVLLQNQNYQYMLLLGNKHNLVIDKINLNDTQDNENFCDDFLKSLEQKQAL